MSEVAEVAQTAGETVGHAPDRVEDAFSTGMLSRASVAALNKRFVTAKPFPHVVIDNLFQPAFLEDVLQDYSAGFRDWVHYDSANEVKTGTRPNAKLGHGAQRYFDAVHRGAFVQFLGGVTAIAGLLPDPSLFGGGLHKIEVGGRFATHVDFNKHPVTRLDNRLVFITYLNKGWQPEWGGALELWDAQTKQCVEKVVPVFGRSILFAHSQTSLHGHPDPVASPDKRPRRSVAAYYYTNGALAAPSDPVAGTQFLHPVAKSDTHVKLAKMGDYVSPMLMDGVRLAFHASKNLARRFRA